MAEKFQVTLKDIATRLGVSTATVSLALRNHPDVAQATRDKVMATAEEMGYRPNPMVATLMSYMRAGQSIPPELRLALVTNFPRRDGWKEHHMHAAYARGMESQAERHGYRIEEFWLREKGMSPRRLSSILYHRNMTGVIIAPLPVDRGHIRLDWDRLSAVTLGYTLVKPSLHRADNFVFQSNLMAAREAHRLGYRRLGLATPRYDDERVDRQLSSGFMAAQRDWRLSEIAPFLVVEEEWNAKTFIRWVKKQRPDVVFSIQPEAKDWLEEAGYRVPEDIGFVCLNCPERDGQLSGIYQNGEAVGAAAVDMLVGMIHRNERGIPQRLKNTLIQGEWVAGKTVRRVNVPE